NISSVVVDGPHRVILVLHNADAVLPFRLGESSAVILHPATAADAADRPVGTGPYRLERWDKGRSHAGALGRPSQPRGSAAEPGELPLPQRAGSAAGGAAGGRGRRHAALKQLQADKRFGVQIGVTAGKGILAINNRKPPFNDLRVRRALAHAVDRKAFISGAQEGLGRPIGSHVAPLNVGYVELSGRYHYDPAKARALLREAGVRTPLNVTLSLPPPPYARIGGPIIAAQLAQVGVMAKIEHLDWDQWTAGPYKGDFDLTLFNHVDPLDYAATYADPDNYFGYDSARFRGLVAVLDATTDPAQKARLWRSIQTQLADDAVNVFIWNPAQVAVARRGLRGLWVNSPIFANDLSAL
ncbi:MAG: ABC transporter substrate-binding protein, partial [Rubrivivax sp.]|nr:ABC transporter substrate-binding protein [Rubrivivax sp.]